MVERFFIFKSLFVHFLLYVKSIFDRNFGSKYTHQNIPPLRLKFLVNFSGKSLGNHCLDSGSSFLADPMWIHTSESFELNELSSVSPILFAVSRTGVKIIHRERSKISFFQILRRSVKLILLHRAMIG